MNIQEQLDALKAFKLDGKKYDVMHISLQRGMWHINTKTRFFIKDSEQIVDFLNQITPISLQKNEPEMGIVSIEKTTVLPDKKEPVHVAEIIKDNTGLCGQMTEKLKAIFDELSDNPSEATYKKAAAMKDVAGAVVQVQMMNYKFLTLNSL